MKRNNVVSMNRENATTEMFSQIMASSIKVGNKNFAYVPLRLLFVDEDYQRQTSKAKVRKLAEKWNINKMDALRVSPHPEEGKFSIIDGSHRFHAAQMNGEKFLACEIIMGLSENPDKRKVEEAKLFSTQNDEVNKLTAQEKHKANLLLGVKENVILEKVRLKYRISLKPDSARGNAKENCLAGFQYALRIAKTYGEELLNDIFCVLCESRWNMANNGLGRDVLEMVKNVLLLHPDFRPEIKMELTEYFKNREPEDVFAGAREKYSLRAKAERNTLFLEDYLIEEIDGMYRVYSGGPVKSYLKAI